MQQALILDTETTGLDEPDVIQIAQHGPLNFEIASWDEAPSLAKMFMPRKPISIGAMATHRIIMKDLEGCDTWTGKWELPPEVGYLIGHAIDYGWQSIGAPDVKRICMLALSKRVWPDLDSYKLVALMYHMYGPETGRQLTTNAHNASADVYLARLVLESVVRKTDATSWEHLWQLSEEARIPVRIGFGKFGPKDGKPGALYSDLVQSRDGLSYLRWMVGLPNPDFDPYELIAARRHLGLA